MVTDSPQSLHVVEPGAPVEQYVFDEELTAVGADDTAPNHRLTSYVELAVLGAVLAAAVTTALTLPRLGREALLSPVTAAGFLVFNLLPAIALLVLIGRRVALRRAARAGGQGHLHTRLVALFSLTAAIPTLLIVVFASIMFQSGMSFWFSEKSRGMFENAVSVAQNFFENEKQDVGANALAMSIDLRGELSRSPINSPGFMEYYVQQVVVRELSESVIIEIGEDGVPRTAALIDPDNRAAENRVPADKIQELQSGKEVVTWQSGDRAEAVVRLFPDQQVYLYAARGSAVFGPEAVKRAQSVFSDYESLYSRSRDLQYRFIVALYFGSLILIGLVIAVAILVADRIARPIEDLVGAAQRVAGGDFNTRVDEPQGRPDEISVLANAFNGMTEQLSKQTHDLLVVNEQLDNRRAFIEAVLSGVTSGVLSLDDRGDIRLVNNAAAAMLDRVPADLHGVPLTKAVPELADWIAADTGDPILTITIDGDQRTWVAKSAQDEHGRVITFEDITQQLSDQRRAAWSDVARRVAHEIKNPLTPIQLAAERLQRRFGNKLTEDEALFQNLTSTIVRQVGDLRRMVDEFSSFARMPKPLFRMENVGEILRQAVFLHEVARPRIRFETDMPDVPVKVMCDRRLLGQAFSNLVKNAAEAIDRTDRDGVGEIVARIMTCGERIEIRIEDDGVGLPHERDRIVEPYMTTREGGTGLGLAIVKKIIEEHGGDLHFTDREGGGTVITINLHVEPPSDVGTKAEQADTEREEN